MLTLRHPRSAAQYFKEQDPNTAISEAYIRRLIREGEIASIRNGAKILVSIESLEQYFATKLKD